MKQTPIVLVRMVSRWRPLLALSSVTAWAAGWALQANAQVAVDVLGTLPAAEYNTWIAPQTYNDWGNEPFIAVNPTDPSKIVISSFAYVTPNQASLWYSIDGGKDWGIRFPITTPPSGQVPGDQTFAYDSAGVLHGALLTRDGSLIYHGTTVNPNNDGVNGRPAPTWNWNATAINSGITTFPDQPYMAVGSGKVFIGYDNFGAPGGVEERASRSLNNGASFTTDVPIGTPGGAINRYQNSPAHYINPGTRIAMDGNGKVYSIVGFATNNSGGIPIMQYRLNRNSGAAAWDYTANNAPIGGLVIDSGTSKQGDDPAFSFGGVNMLRGNITAIATDKTGTHIYTVYGKQLGGVDRLFLAEFHNDGTGNLVERAIPVALSIAGQRAALPSVAVTDDGKVYVLYDTFTSADNLFHVHLALSLDQGLTFAPGDDKVLEDFTAPFTSTDRILGDYQYITALGNTVEGTFAGRGLAAAQNPNGFDRSSAIDPFFFSVVPEPSALTLVGVGLSCALLARRRVNSLIFGNKR